MWVTVKDSAHCLKVSVRTVQQWIKAGELVSVDGYVNQARAEVVRDAMRKRRAEGYLLRKSVIR